MKTLSTQNALRTGLWGLTLALFAASCASRPGAKGFVRVSTVVIDEMEGEGSVGPFTLSGDTDYEAVDVAIGSAAYDEDRKISSWELGVSDSEYGDVDTLELFVGGRWYLAPGETIHPYFNALVVHSDFDDDDTGSDFDGQFSFRPGFGAELALGRDVYLDFLGSYQIPIVEAEDSSGVELDVDGFSFRVGVGFSF